MSQWKCHDLLLLECSWAWSVSRLGVNPGKMAGEIRLWKVSPLSLEPLSSASQVALLPRLPPLRCKLVNSLSLEGELEWWLWSRWQCALSACSAPALGGGIQPLLSKAAGIWTESSMHTMHQPALPTLEQWPPSLYLSTRLWLWDSHFPLVCVKPVSLHVGPLEASGELHIKFPSFSKENPASVWRQPFEVSCILPHWHSTLLPGFLPQASMHTALHPHPQTWLWVLSPSSGSVLDKPRRPALLACEMTPNAVCLEQGRVVAHTFLAVNTLWLASNSGSASYWLCDFGQVMKALCASVSSSI